MKLDLNSKIELHTGRMMPVMGLGTWQLTQNTAEVVALALESGYPMIDTSGDYGTQPGIAQGLRESGKRRDEYYIVTKVEVDEDAYDSAERQVRELGLTYANMILIHRPPRKGAGVDLWRGLIEAKKDGLTKDIGVSNYSIELMEELAAATNELPTTNQIEWSPFGYNKEMYDWCRRHHVVIEAYSPITRKARLGSDAIAEIAAKYGKTPAQILIRWHLQHGVVPLPKANDPDHLLENIEVFDFELSEADDERLDKLNEHYSSLGSLPYVRGQELVFHERLESDD